MWVLSVWVIRNHITGNVTNN